MYSLQLIVQICNEVALLLTAENLYDLNSPDGSGNPPVPVPKLRDGTGDWSVQQDNIACEDKSLLLKFSA